MQLSSTPLLVLGQRNWLAAPCTFSSPSLPPSPTSSTFSCPPLTSQVEMPQCLKVPLRPDHNYTEFCCCWTSPPPTLLVPANEEGSPLSNRFCPSVKTQAIYILSLPGRTHRGAVVVVQPPSPVQLCNPMDCSMPGIQVPHHLPEFAQVHIHCLSDAIQRCS